MKKENLIFIAEAMKHQEVVDIVTTASEKIWYFIPDVTSFEHRCYRNIGKALMEGNVKSIRGLSKHLIRRAMAIHVKQTKYKPPQSLDTLAFRDDEGNDVQYEVIDVLADVEQIVVEKESEIEKVALLAEGDSRKRMILNAWLNGMTNDKELSTILEKEFGGKRSGQRRYIQRFKEKCQQRLADAV